MMVRALQILGDPLYEEVAGRRKVWHLMASAHQQTITEDTTFKLLGGYWSRRVISRD
jgi:hypothetical protein